MRNPAIIDPHAVFTIASATALLGLRKNTLPREARERRLRVSKRAGRYFILGEWLIEWLRSGEVLRQSVEQEQGRPTSNGHRD
jgi:hypothetical protein